MAGAIGPGSIVQRIREIADGSLSLGALYRVEAISPDSFECISCGDFGPVIHIAGKPRIRPPPKGRTGALYGYCACGFAPWPPEPPSELLEEQETKEVIREGAL